MNSDLHLIGQHNALLGDVTLLGKEVHSVVSVKRMTRAAGFFHTKLLFMFLNTALKAVYWKQEGNLKHGKANNGSYSGTGNGCNNMFRWSGESGWYLYTAAR